MSRATLYCGHVVDVLRSLPADSVQCVVTSPPYWGLRDYGVPASTWGGAVDCPHEWVDRTKHAGGAYVQGSKKRWQHERLQEQFQTDRSSLIDGHPEIPAGATCSLCDAWRGALGLEPTPDLFVAHVVSVFEEVRRVLRPDGTLWLNMGDCYAAAPHGHNGFGTSTLTGSGQGEVPRARVGKSGNKGNAAADIEGPHRASGGPRVGHGSSFRRDRRPREDEPHKSVPGLKPKDLVMMPARVALALQAAGWWVRMDTIWSKPNPMPESVTDRPTRAHEYVFLLSKSERYFYDAAAIAEPLSPNTHARLAQNVEAQVGSARANGGAKTNGNMKAVVRGSNRKLASHESGIKQNDSFDDAMAVRGGKYKSGNKRRDIPADADGRGIPNDHRGRGIPWEDDGGGRNARSVWEIATQPYKGAHFATFPPELARRCILAGSRPGDTVLDPFGGSGTTAATSTGSGRDSIYIDLKPDYLELARQRIGPMLCDVVAA